MHYRCPLCRGVAEVPLLDAGAISLPLDMFLCQECAILTPTERDRYPWRRSAGVVRFCASRALSSQIRSIQAQLGLAGETYGSAMMGMEAMIGARDSGALAVSLGRARGK